jgi:hypothetical protein
MPLNEQQFAARIITALDERELPAHIANRLMMARARALDAAARASPAGRNTLVLSRRSLVGLTGALLLLLAASGWYFNNMSACDPENADIDAAVLSDDLPVPAYVDRGFEAYLHQKLATE